MVGLYSRLSPLLCAIASTLAVLVFVESRLRPDLVAGLPLSAVIADKSDDYGMIAHTLANWRQRTAKTVVAVGGSAMKEGLPPRDRFEVALSIAFHDAVIYENLSGYAQTMVESLRIIDYLSRHDRLRTGDIVLLHVNPFRFSNGREEALRDTEASRIPLLDNSATTDLLRQLGVETGWRPRLWQQRYAARRFLLGRLSPQWQECLLLIRRLAASAECLRTFASEPIIRENQIYVQYARRTVTPDTERLAEVADIRNRTDALERNIAFSARVLRRIQEIVSARGAELVLVELPRDPLSDQAYAGVHHSYSAAISSAQATGARYVDLRDSDRFPSARFYDLDHPLPATREEAAALLLDKIIDRKVIN